MSCIHEQNQERFIVDWPLLPPPPPAPLPPPPPPAWTQSHKVWVEEEDVRFLTVIFTTIVLKRFGIIVWFQTSSDHSRTRWQTQKSKFSLPARTRLHIFRCGILECNIEQVLEHDQQYDIILTILIMMILMLIMMKQRRRRMTDTDTDTDTW